MRSDWHFSNLFFHPPQGPAYRNLFNWRGQIFCVMGAQSSLHPGNASSFSFVMIAAGAGIAGFWIRGEQAVLRCHHARDAQRLKDIREGRTMA
jgi:hypothetical protein